MRYFSKGEIFSIFNSLLVFIILTFKLFTQEFEFIRRFVFGFRSVLVGVIISTVTTVIALYLLQKRQRKMYLHQPTTDGGFMIHTGSVIYPEGKEFVQKIRKPAIDKPIFRKYILLLISLLIGSLIYLQFDQHISPVSLNTGILGMHILYVMSVNSQLNKTKDSTDDLLFQIKKINTNFILALRRIADYTLLEVKTQTLNEDSLIIDNLPSTFPNIFTKFARLFNSEKYLQIELNEFDIISDKDDKFKNGPIKNLIISQGTTEDLQFFKQKIIYWLNSQS